MKLNNEVNENSDKEEMEELYETGFDRGKMKYLIKKNTTVNCMSSGRSDSYRMRGNFLSHRYADLADYPEASGIYGTLPAITYTKCYALVAFTYLS